MSIGSFWVPPSPEFVADLNNPFDMMAVEQERLATITDPEERMRQVEIFFAGMGEQGIDFEQFRNVSLGTDLALIPTPEQGDGDARLLEREVGFLGEIKGFGYTEIAQRVLGLTISLDATYIFDRETPDDSDIFMRQARTPISYVKYIEFL